MLSPETRYAKSGDVNIAYQVLGKGPIDVVYVPSWVSHIEHMWEEPSVVRSWSAWHRSRDSSSSTAAAPVCPTRS